MNYIACIAIAAGLPTALTGFLFYLLEKKMERREVITREKEAKRQQKDLLIINGIGASIALGEATALALRNGHTNGETEAALAYARDVKHEQKEFLNAVAVEALNE